MPPCLNPSHSPPGCRSYVGTKPCFESTDPEHVSPASELPDCFPSHFWNMVQARRRGRCGQAPPVPLPSRRVPSCACLIPSTQEPLERPAAWATLWCSNRTVSTPLPSAGRCLLDVGHAQGERPARLPLHQGSGVLRCVLADLAMSWEGCGCKRSGTAAHVPPRGPGHRPGTSESHVPRCVWLEL